MQDYFYRNVIVLFPSALQDYHRHQLCTTTALFLTAVENQRMSFCHLFYSERFRFTS